jgi:hypothetical protein
MKRLRWPDGVVVCPTCGTDKVRFVSTRKVWECSNAHSRRQFSIKVGTIMEDSPIKLDKWMTAMWLIANAKNGISSYELHRAIGITQKSAWFMLHRIRLAMQGNDGGKLNGHLEVDETYIGGLARNMHKAKRDRVIGKGHGVAGKVAIMGLLQRHGSRGHSVIRAAVVKSTNKRTLQLAVRSNAEAGSTISSDKLKSYTGLDDAYVHGVIDHAEKYVDGQVHTNGCENFWSLLKRTLKGTYVAVEPFHLFRYLDEQVFRFNERKLTDAERFILTAASVFGKRLTYKELTAADTTAY